MLSWRSRWWWALAGAAFLLAAQLQQPAATRARVRHRLVSRTELDGVPPEYILTNALLGGFRTAFIQVLWQRAQEMKQENKYYEMVDIYNIITKLQPGHHMAWAFQAWDLSYNVSVEFANLDDRIFWVFRGIDLLRFQGIPKNDRIPELPYELAWIFHHKIGASLDFAHPYYRTALANQVADAMLEDYDAEAQATIIDRVARVPAGRREFLQNEIIARAFQRLADAGVPDPFDLGPGLARIDPDDAIRGLEERARRLADNPGLAAAFRPAAAPLDVEAARRAFADPEVRRALESLRLWFIGDGLRTTLGFDPVKMRDIVARYGVIDWRTPYAHCLYWALIARDLWWSRPDKEPDLKFERLIYFALIQLSENSRLIRGSDGFAHYLPDYRLLDAVVRHMGDLQDRYRDWKGADGTGASLTGMMSAYTYFLRDAVFLSFYDGRERQAQRLLDQLVMVQWQRQIETYGRDKRLTDEQAGWIRDNDLSHIGDLRAVIGVEAKYDGPVERVVKTNLADFLDSPGPDRANALVESWLANAYWGLTLGDTDRFRKQSLLAQTFHQEYMLRRWPQDAADIAGEIDNRHYIPPLEDLRLGVLTKIYTLNSQFAYTPDLLGNLLGALRQYEPRSFERLIALMQARPDAPVGGAL